MSLTTVFQAYQDDGRMNIRALYKKKRDVSSEKSRLQQDSNSNPHDPTSGAL